jgi:hypothetical protein
LLNLRNRAGRQPPTGDHNQVAVADFKGVVYVGEIRQPRYFGVRVARCVADLNIDNSPASAAAVLYGRCGDTISAPKDSRTDQTSTVPAEGRPGAERVIRKIEAGTCAPSGGNMQRRRSG